jgi:hypothetical protein
MENIALIEEKIDLGKSLIEKLGKDFQYVDGALKTKRNIEKEITFLQKVNISNFFKVNIIFLILFLFLS